MCRATAVFALFAFSTGCGGSDQAGSQTLSAEVFLVYVRSDETVAGSASRGSSFGASFAPAFSDCSTAMVESCDVLSCRMRNPPAPTSPHAGEITLAVGARSLTLSPDSSGFYPHLIDSEKLWTGDETLLFAAKGGEIPAFNESLVAPHEVVLETPVGPGGDIAISRAAPREFRWTGGSSGGVLFSLSSYAGSRNTVVYCRYPVSAGRASLPAAALSQLPAGSGALIVSVREEKRLSNGGYETRIVAETPSVDSTGAAREYRVLIE